MLPFSINKIITVVVKSDSYFLLFQKENVLLKYDKINVHLLCNITMVAIWLSCGCHVVTDWLPFGCIV